MPKLVLPKTSPFSLYSLLTNEKGLILVCIFLLEFFESQDDPTKLVPCLPEFMIQSDLPIGPKDQSQLLSSFPMTLVDMNSTLST